MQTERPAIVEGNLTKGKVFGTMEAGRRDEIEYIENLSSLNSILHYMFTILIAL